MPYETKYIPGQYHFICDICGMQRRSPELRINWKNQATCPECFETKHPQLEVPPATHNEGVPKGITQGEPVDVFLPQVTIDYDSPFPNAELLIVATEPAGSVFNSILVEDLGTAKSGDTMHIDSANGILYERIILSVVPGPELIQWVDTINVLNPPPANSIPAGSIIYLISS